MEKVSAFATKVFPIVTWLPKYKVEHGVRDLIAGLTVGLTVIPQGLAYANLAELPSELGLYSSFMGVFIYCLFGTSKDITLGPTAIMSILVAKFCARPDHWPTEYPSPATVSDPALAINLTFISGCILLVLGILKLGFVVNFISHAVIVGFCSAASIIISFSQVKKLFGIHLHHREFFKALPELAMEIGQLHINWYDFAMGITCMAILKSLELMKRKYQDSDDINPVARKVIWLVGTARNAIVVVIAACVAYAVDNDEINYWVDSKGKCETGKANCTTFTLTKIENAAMPAFLPPQFSYSYSYQNGTDLASHTVTFPDILKTLSAGLFIIPLMAYLESISIAKGFAIKNDYKVDASQELVAIGLANSISSFVSSYPVTGSFSRTAVNSQSNVATPAGGLVCGSLVLIALLFLTPIFVYIPSACLGGVIILAAISMFDIDGIKHTWRLYRLDIVPLSCTFFLCFWDIANGIIAGIGVHLLLLLYKLSKPNQSSLDDNQSGIITIRPQQGLYYPAAEYLTNQIEAAVYESAKVVTLDLSHISEIDSGTADVIKNNLNFVKKNGRDAVILYANNNVTGILEAAGASQFLPSNDELKSPENAALLDT